MENRYVNDTMEEESSSQLFKTTGSTSSDDVKSIQGYLESSSDNSIAKGGVTTPFPWKLHIMLDHMEEKGDKSICAWQPHGRAFTVYKPKEFVTSIMPNFFNQTKYASFQRQLNLYSFARLTHGPDKGAYYHPCFVRGKAHLCKRMVRQKIKGTKVRKSLAPEEEPNFYTMSGTLPSIPSEESIDTNVEEKPSTLLQLSADHTPHEVTPIPVKPVKRTTGRRSSKAGSLEFPVVSQQQQPQSASSFVELPNPLRPLGQATRTVSPHHFSCSIDETEQKYQQDQFPTPYRTARGGDLLFFEGQPFRYLEHIEDLPPMPSSVMATRDEDRGSLLHSTITAIVSRDKLHKQPNQVIAVGNNDNIHNSI